VVSPNHTQELAKETKQSPDDISERREEWCGVEDTLGWGYLTRH